jgi:dTDP-glucose pyrophosphorylase
VTASEEVWRRATVDSTATVQQVIKTLEDGAIKIVIVVDVDGKLEGTVSDGDIRRALLRGTSLDSGINEVIHRNPIVVPPEMSRETVLKLMTANKIQQVPVVDERRKVVGLHLWDDMISPKERANKMVIMAGGKGARLRPHTEHCPKPMLQIAGKPMLEHIIERARDEGFCSFILAVHYLSHIIENHFGDGHHLGVHIEYVRESRPLGTAGALGLLESVPDQDFIVTNGDVITDIRYGELLDFHVHHNAAATMAVRIHEWQHPFGVVHTKGDNIMSFEEKPITRSHINAGVYALRPDALNLVARDEHCDMPALFTRLQSESKDIVAYPMHEPWLDVGRQDDLLRANEEYQTI